MDIAQPISSTISSISFSHLHSSDIRRISVKQVVNPVLFDNLNQPNAGGMYDPAFGPRGKGDICTTCKLSSFDCPGHFGHIDLPVPVFHPLYMTQCFQLLRGTCTYCHHFLASETSILQFIAKLTLLEHGLIVPCEQVDNIVIRTAAKAPKGAAGKAANVTLSDAEEGESTEEPGETLEGYKERLERWVQLQVKLYGKGSGRDEYKKSGLVYDKRKKVIHEFLKGLNKKKCSRCGAFAHRMRKEGSTRVVEYGLVGKQRDLHRAAGIKRRAMNILIILGDRSVREIQDVGKVIENGEEEVDEDSDDDEDDDPIDSNKKGKGRPDDESSDESESEKSSSPDEDAMDLAEDGAAPLDSDAPKNGQLGSSRTRQSERIMPPNEVRAHLRLVFMNEPRIVSLLYAPHGPLATSSSTSTSTASFSSRSKASADIFFMDVVSVPPTRFRPAATMGDQVFENPQNSLLNSILRQTFTVRDLNAALEEVERKPALENGVEGLMEVEGEEKPLQGRRKPDAKRLYTQLLESLINLQVVVNSMIDSTKNPMIVKGGKLPPQGVKQMLEKKEGLFRMNMMGKRVNYAARSVISPDVNIETNEIGVPPVFARKLTFPEPVTEHNVNYLRQLVINGPHVHPGASFVQMTDGTLTSLDRKSEDERTTLANGLLTPDSNTNTLSTRLDRPDVGLPHTRTPQINKKVYRHLADGDIVILNRQPTLHKPSMMCHRVRVLKGERTIRMHYANCNSYNADFDGDEMNMHFPQSLIAQAEARLIANTDNQYLVPTSGNPLRGLIQDHVAAGVWLTNKDTFFTRQEYQQLLYGALRPENLYSGGKKQRNERTSSEEKTDDMLLTLPPAIWKPQPLWSGKQVISTIMQNINPYYPEGGVNFQCKAKVPGAFWGVHSSEETVLFVDGELLTGVLDKAQIGASPFGLVHSVHELYGPEVAGKLLSILSRVLTKFLQSRAFSCRMDDLLLTDKGNADRRAMLSAINVKGLDAALDYVGLSTADKDLPETADDLRRRLEEVLRDDYKLAGLDATVEGETNTVTTQLIKTCLPSGLVKPFPHNNMQMMTVSGAKGSNVNASQISCLLGQQSLEGRRVPTMVSGKTLPSFKAFETAPRAGGFVAGRFLTGIRPQEYYFHCMAGREGLIDTAVKTSRSGYLQRCLIKHLEGLRVHYDNTVRNSDSSVLQFNYGEDSIDVTKKAHLHQIEFAVRNTEALIKRHDPRTLLPHVHQMGSKPIQKALKNPAKYPPILSYISPATHLGSVSEPYAAAVEKYIEENPHRLLARKSKKKPSDPDPPKWPEYARLDRLMAISSFRSLMYMRYMRALVEPGEAVGLLASQGVGEPSTQMTLNTFHFAGHGAANVTLGIPRLREIVMTASQNIRTPTMQLPVLPHIGEATIKKFCQSSTRLTLSQIVDEVTVQESLSTKSERNASRQKLYTVRLALYPQEDYVAEYSVSPEQILLGIQRSFIPTLDRAILKQVQQTDKEQRGQAGDFGRGKKEAPLRAAGDDDDADDEGPVARGTGEEDDGDADDARRGRQGQDEVTYDSDEDEDDVGSEVNGDSDDSDDDEKKKGKKAIKKAKAAEASLEAAFESSDDSATDSDEEDDSKAKARREKRNRQDTEARMKVIQSKITTASRYVNRVRFDLEKGEWCEFDLEFLSTAHKLLLVGIVESCCRTAIVHEVPGISRCFEGKAANENAAAAQSQIVTEGVNLRGCWSFGYEVVDLNKIYTNDIGAILRTYGVEAARKSIITEMSGVFSVYGIGVDYRHLTIIADYMTSEGAYKPFNRTGLSNNSSPFLKASFETTANFIAEAALYGDFDDLGTPSANIVLGKPPKSGTGVFDVLAAVAV